MKWITKLNKERENQQIREKCQKLATELFNAKEQGHEYKQTIKTLQEEKNFYDAREKRYEDHIARAAENVTLGQDVSAKTKTIEQLQKINQSQVEKIAELYNLRGRRMTNELHMYIFVWSQCSMFLYNL